MKPLVNNTIITYQASLDELARQLPPSILTNEEQSRASRYLTEEQRSRFIASRTLLRLLLSYYSEQTPREIVFAFMPHGKPYLRDSNISFNISHSHGQWICALALDTPLGIDIEYRDKTRPIDALAKRYFKESEYHQIIEATAETQLSLFYDLWTLKEALAKAHDLPIFRILNKSEFVIRPIELIAFETNEEHHFIQTPHPTHFAAMLCSLGKKKEVLHNKVDKQLLSKIIS